MMNRANKLVLVLDHLIIIWPDTKHYKALHEPVGFVLTATRQVDPALQT